VYDNFFINLAVHASLLKNLQFKKAKILYLENLHTSADDKKYIRRGEGWFYYNYVISQGVY